jgi:hypothetical protein
MKALNVFFVLIMSLAVQLAVAAPEAEERELAERLKRAEQAATRASSSLTSVWDKYKNAATAAVDQVVTAGKTAFGQSAANLNDIRTRVRAAGSPLVDPSSAYQSVAAAARAQASARQIGAKASADRESASAAFAKAREEAGKATVEAFSSSYAAVSTTTSAATRALATRTHDAALALELRASDMDSNFGLLISKFDDVDYTLDEMNRYYDQAMIGAYMKEKMGALLNSDVICSAAKRCAVKDPKKIPNADIEKELFPNTSNSTRKGDYYDAVRRGSDQ